MLVKVDFSKNMFRLLYAPLYERVRVFALETGANELLVKARFISLIAGDEIVQLLVDIDEDAEITAHCLFILKTADDGKLTALVEQIKVDSGHDAAFAKACITAIESIPNIQQIGMFTSEKKYKAFRKQYGFKVERVIMVREANQS